LEHSPHSRYRTDTEPDRATWKEFIGSQAKGIIATDFLCADTATLRRFHVLFFIEIGSHRVHLGGITANPTGPWTTQAARNLASTVDERFRFVIHDGAGQYTRSFDANFWTARSSGTNNNSGHSSSRTSITSTSTRPTGR